MPVQRGEGPVGIVICPSRELARQTYDIVVEYSEALKQGEAPCCAPGRFLIYRSALAVLLHGPCTAHACL